MIYLLDINVLISLTDPMHVHHELAHQWFAEIGRHSWATCPITENGFIRITSHQKYPNRPGDAQVVISILRQICSSTGHHFWAEDLSILGIIKPNSIITPNQITDVYLLGLAIHKQGKLATLDQKIPLAAVRGGNHALELIK